MLRLNDEWCAALIRYSEHLPHKRQEDIQFIQRCGKCMQYFAILQLLFLMVLANGSPVIAKWILGNHCSWPLDGNIKFIDGRPLFGRSKTVRGILVSLFMTSAGAPLIGLTLNIGLLVATMAMAGDLFSSFIKRRFGLPPSGKAAGLDQIPESLLPLLACRPALSLTALDVFAGTALFFVGDVVLSRVLYSLHIREQPY
jgi:CDP-2,3-bis-(O-geranylgeranyl)-sn-glycerol synthase